MALKIPLFSPNYLQQPRQFPNHRFTTTTTLIPNRPNMTHHNILCSKKGLSDRSLALDLAISVEKINTQLEQKEKALKKSRELLFTEICQYLSSKEEEVNKKWKKMKEEEKWVLVEKFVNEWGVNFHPLSVRSVKEMVDEHLQEDRSSSPSVMFPGLKRMLGFSQDN